MTVVVAPIATSTSSMIVRVAGATDASNQVILHADVRLDDTELRVEHDHVGDDHVQLRAMTG